jgi:hypothetical protein
MASLRRCYYLLCLASLWPVLVGCCYRACPRRGAPSADIICWTAESFLLSAILATFAWRRGRAGQPTWDECVFSRSPRPFAPRRCRAPSHGMGRPASSIRPLASAGGGCRGKAPCLCPLMQIALECAPVCPRARHGVPLPMNAFPRAPLRLRSI